MLVLKLQLRNGTVLFGSASKLNHAGIEKVFKNDQGFLHLPVILNQLGIETLPDLCKGFV